MKTMTKYSKTSISGTSKIPGGSCHLSNCATYWITFMYKRYCSNFDGSGNSVPLIESCHLWECHLWRFYCSTDWHNSSKRKYKVTRSCHRTCRGGRSDCARHSEMPFVLAYHKDDHSQGSQEEFHGYADRSKSDFLKTSTLKSVQNKASVWQGVG